MCLTWIAIIASLPMGIGSAVILSFTVTEDCYCNIKNRERHSNNSIVSASASLKTSLQEKYK
jgi:hypothetical protein